MITTELATQQAFRTIMRAMGNPGAILRLDTTKTETLALRLVCATLFDQEVMFCLIGDKRTRDLEDSLHERTKSPIAALSAADFIIVDGNIGNGQLLSAKKGSPEFPDRGATVIICLETLAEGNEDDFQVALSGPGIPGQRRLRIRGLAREVLSQLQELNSRYPLGVDSIFIDAKDCIACIPRSSKIQVR